MFTRIRLPKKVRPCYSDLPNQVCYELMVVYMHLFHLINNSTISTQTNILAAQ